MCHAEGENPEVILPHDRILIYSHDFLFVVV